MKAKKVPHKPITFIFILVFLFVISPVSIFAHNAVLLVNYDTCTPSENDDGIAEAWYALETSVGIVHLDTDVNTIKYFFEESLPDGSYSWTTDIEESAANNIKNLFANSMKKWNNVYFYDYDDSGVLVKHKIINIVEGDESDHNLSIYPRINETKLASISYRFSNKIEDPNTQYHKHSNDWALYVAVNLFCTTPSTPPNELIYIFEKTGAHEIGHILGLSDMDVCCSEKSMGWHHNELLMGYDDTVLGGTADITYKDIAGVAITRGFHTDDDHKWLNCGLQEDGTYKLICSICNGVKNVNSLSGYDYNTYGICNNDHSLFSENMMPVASYGTNDYYKCRYCRYVAPFDSNAPQNYTKTYHDEIQHECVNNTVGLEYTFYENHDRNTYTFIDNYTHRCSCSCGIDPSIEPHVIEASSATGIGKFAKCLGCGYLVDIRDDYFNSIVSITKVSANGSYILNSGIIVLVEQDLQAYFKRTLIFYQQNNIPSAQ